MLFFVAALIKKVVVAYVTTPNSLVCTSPSFSLSDEVSQLKVNVSVSLNGAQYSKVQNHFSFYHGVQILKISPSIGPKEGGTEITIEGRNFFASSVGKCKFGNVTTPFTYKLPTLIKCISPPNPSGGFVTVDVSMNDADYSSSGVHFKYNSRANISHILPLSGPIKGGTSVTLYGSHFSSTSALSCLFDDIVVEAVFLSKNTMLCTSPKVPASKKKVVLAVTDNGVDLSNGIDFIYYNEPSLINVKPSFGSVDGGTTVQVSVTNIGKAEKIVCKFGESSVSGSYNSNTSIIACVSPPAKSGLAADVTFSLNGGFDFGTESKAFHYLKTPTISHITPKVGPLGGGTTVFLSGNHFINTTSLSCKFGDRIVKAKYISKMLINCAVPGVNETGAVSLDITTNGLDFIYSEFNISMLNMLGLHHCIR